MFKSIKPVSGPSCLIRACNSLNRGCAEPPAKARIALSVVVNQHPACFKRLKAYFL